MHSMLHYQMYRTLADDRASRPRGEAIARRRQHPPPVRERAAYAAARIAHRLDSESARRAIA
jgi:hypothetical protein